MHELGAILESGERKQKLAALDNKTLATRLLEKVWAHAELFSEESDLLSAAIDRLKQYPSDPSNVSHAGTIP